jgi:hypothetical protein
MACILAGQDRDVYRALVLIVLMLTPALAGCSSFSSSSSAAQTSPATNQTAAAPAPPASDPAASLSPYPNQSLVDWFRGTPGPSGSAPGVPRPPSTYTASSPPYQPGYDASASSAAQPASLRPPSAYTPSSPPYQVNQPNQPGYDAAASSAAAPATPAPAAAQDNSAQPASSFPYPQQSLSDVFSRSR